MLLFVSQSFYRIQFRGAHSGPAREKKVQCKSDHECEDCVTGIKYKCEICAIGR